MSPFSQSAFDHVKLHRQYFNGIACEWDTFMDADPALENYVQEFRVTAGDFVLDLGAGTGRVTRILDKLVRPGGKVIAADVAEGMLKIGKNGHLRNSFFLCTDACRSAFKNAVFDKIICYSTFPHLPDQRSAVLEFRRTLKKGGDILIFHSCCSRKLNQIHSSLNSIVSRDRLPPVQQIVELFELNGFEIIKKSENPHLYWLQARKK